MTVPKRARISTEFISDLGFLRWAGADREIPSSDYNSWPTSTQFPSSISIKYCCPFLFSLSAATNPLFEKMSGIEGHNIIFWTDKPVMSDFRECSKLFVRPAWVWRQEVPFSWDRQPAPGFLSALSQGYRDSAAKTSGVRSISSSAAPRDGVCPKFRWRCRNSPFRVTVCYTGTYSITLILLFFITIQSASV